MRTLYEIDRDETQKNMRGKPIWKKENDVKDDVCIAQKCLEEMMKDPRYRGRSASSIPLYISCPCSRCNPHIL